MTLGNARQALSALREANDRLAEGYRYAMMDYGDNDIVGWEGEARNTAHVADMHREWLAALGAFRQACSHAAPEVDGSLRLADVESIDNSVLSIREFAAFDRHVHELFTEIRVRWATLADEPPLTDHEEDDLALRSDWRIALERRPVLYVGTMLFCVWFLATFFWMIITNM